MTREFKCLMYIVGCTSKGSSVDGVDTKCIDWAKVYQQANVQTVSFLLTHALRKNRELACPENLKKEQSAYMFETFVRENEKKSNVLNLLREMENNGIRSILLKGYVVADCYAVPECRPSTDVDILVSRSQEVRACAFLQKKGFSIYPRWTDGHHSVCYHPDYGTIEVHVELFDRIIQKVWFRNIELSRLSKRCFERIETKGGSYYTLEYTDNLLFLTLHAIKHFVIKGINLRMMLDIALFIRKYVDLIDFSRYWSTLEELNYDKLVGSFLWALINYCGFDDVEFPGIPDERREDVETLLADMEQGEYHNDELENNSFAVYTAYMQRKGTRLYHISLLMQKVCRAFRRIFPSRIVLMSYTPLVGTSAFFVPFGWLLHVLHGLHIIVDKSEEGNIKTINNRGSRIYKDRVDILKQFEIM